MRAVQAVDVREAGQAQTGCKCAQRKQHGAQQRSLPQPEDVGTKAHNLSLYRDGVVQAALRCKRQIVGGVQFRMLSFALANCVRAKNCAITRSR
jgi:hypothetical protein